ncbi:MAG: hypothetical protein F6K40_31620 [Okeania sp. SIO3I5]|uniref:hypothetical protein n=1 Tax=Okeania sp. SIO3I5 TaxID=2607805 RepID=UPI0013B75979|nr:hypothetical protein [Okeania sp. SIO3I5]NEQ40534.1 hypothetical protein [Okeania sp. SIO3I5]
MLRFSAISVAWVESLIDISSNKKSNQLSHRNHQFFLPAPGFVVIAIEHPVVPQGSVVRVVRVVRVGRQRK